MEKDIDEIKEMTSKEAIEEIKSKLKDDYGLMRRIGIIEKDVEFLEKVRRVLDGTIVKEENSQVGDNSYRKGLSLSFGEEFDVDLLASALDDIGYELRRKKERIKRITLGYRLNGGEYVEAGFRGDYETCFHDGMLFIASKEKKYDELVIRKELLDFMSVSYEEGENDEKTYDKKD